MVLSPAIALNPEKAVRLFYSYSEKDADLRAELEIHLANLRNQGYLHEWHSALIKAGDEPRAEIAERLMQADIILLLISADFLASKSCYEEELLFAVKRHRQRQSWAVPILLRPTELDGAPISQMQVLPHNGKALTEWPNRDLAWVEVVKHLRNIIAEVSNHPISDDSPLPKPSTSHVATPQRRSVPPQPPGAAYHPDWYVRRPEEEYAALSCLENAGAPAVVWAPDLFGKTMLLKHLATELRKATAQSRVLTLDLALFEQHSKNSLSTLLLEMATRIFDALALPVQEVVAAWEGPGDAKKKLTGLLEHRVLGTIQGQLVLTIDRADAVWGTTYQDDFFSMLRSWAEDAYSEPWSRLRLLLSVSTTPTQLCEQTSQSPFNLTPPIYLNEFSPAQAAEMADRYTIVYQEAALDDLMALVGGHPYLLRLAMFKAAMLRLSLTQLLERHAFNGDLFESYLHRHRHWLHRHKDLLQAAQQVAKDPYCHLDLDIYHRLHKAGFVRQGARGAYALRCPLYLRILT